MIKATYDAAGQRTSLTYPGGLTVGYVYNANGRLIAMQDSRAGAAAFAVDPDGRLMTEQLPGRLARRYHYEGGLLHRLPPSSRITGWRPRPRWPATPTAGSSPRLIRRRPGIPLRPGRAARLISGALRGVPPR